MDKIAVIVNNDGLSSTFFDGSNINIYSKAEDSWQCTDCIPINFTTQNGMHILRKRLTEIIHELGSCKTIAGQEILGLPYNVLDVAGLNIFQIEGPPASFLDTINNMLDSDTKNRESKPKTNFQPEPTGTEGCYRINLVDIQKDNHEISSKQILIPFLRNTCFYELEILCNHVPPWFEAEMERLNLRKEVQELDTNLYKVILNKMTCCEQKS